jgi:uncharacterized membrane protein YdjX (TVP38/TMEM64 family)
MAALRWTIVIAVLLVAIVAPFVLFGDRIEGWIRMLVSSPRPGAIARALLVSLLAADVLLPVPSSLVSLACGMWWGPWLGGLLSTLGMTLGSGLAYGLGRWLGTASIRRWVGPREAERVDRLYARHGDWIVALLRPVPVLAEASAVFAGVSRMAWWRFLVLSFLANSTISAFYAAAGSLLARLGFGLEILMLLAALGLVTLLWARARRAGTGPTA